MTSPPTEGFPNFWPGHIPPLSPWLHSLYLPSPIFTLVPLPCTAPPPSLPPRPTDSELGPGAPGAPEVSDPPEGTYSGSNKRKLATAVTLVGDPAAVFLVRGGGPGGEGSGSADEGIAP